MTFFRPLAWTVAAVAANAALILWIFDGYLEIPLRLYEHHLLLLQAHEPDLIGTGFHWRMMHYHLGSETDIHFRYLWIPLIWNLVQHFKDCHSVLYQIAFAAHGAVSLALFWAVQAYTRIPWLAFLSSVLFTVFSAHSDVVGIPYYTPIFVATALAGVGMVCLKRHLESDRIADLLGAFGLFLLASVVYDTFFLALFLIPFLGAGIKKGSWQACLKDVRAWTLTGITLAFFLLGSLGYSHISETLRKTGSAGSLLDTLAVAARRLPAAAVASAGRFVIDGTLFLAGRTPEVAHPGNMPYWHGDMMLKDTTTLVAAVAAIALGLRLVRRDDLPVRIFGTGLLAVGLFWDWHAILPVLILHVFVSSPIRPHRNPWLVSVAVVGYLCALNTALGRSGLYSLRAMRHHHVTSFFLLLGLAVAFRQVLDQGLPARLARLLPCALALSVAFNAAECRRFLSGYVSTNAVVLSFDRELRTLARQEGNGILFVPHSTARIRSPDWNRHVVHDWVFDILHFGKNPLTRWTTRARWIWEDGVRVPNPLFSGPPTPDFRIDFRLDTEKFLLRFDAQPEYRCFGKAEEEPHLVLDREGITLHVTLLSGRHPYAYRFPLPVETNRFFYETKTVSLERAAGRLTLSLEEQVLGSHSVEPGDEYVPWQGDNTGLMGRDIEILMAKHNLYDSYVRIGPALPGRIP